MKDAQSIPIFGGGGDDRMVRLRRLLLECGVCNFESCDAAICRGCDALLDRPGLFIVSRQSVIPADIETIDAEARKLAVPVLYL